MEIELKSAIVYTQATAVYVIINNQSEFSVTQNYV